MFQVEQGRKGMNPKIYFSEKGDRDGRMTWWRCVLGEGSLFWDVGNRPLKKEEFLKAC